MMHPVFGYMGNASSRDSDRGRGGKDRPRLGLSAS